MLREGSVQSSDEVAARLIEAGFEVTQATVARDLEQIGAIKVKRDGRMAYALPERLGERNWPTDRLQRIFAEWAQAVESGSHLHDIVADCQRVTAPTLIVTGEPALDRVVPVESTAGYARLIQGARTCVLERTGHLGTITRPSIFADMVNEFASKPVSRSEVA